MWKIAVVGSRGFKDRVKLANVLDEYAPFHLVSGGADGADRLAEEYCDERELPKTIFPADWHRYGKRAGFVRNSQIVDVAHLVIAFWDGQSKGTKLTIDLAKSTETPLIVVGC